MDFTRIASIYKWAEYLVFGNALQKRRHAFLPDVSGSKNILLLGDGDGRFAAAFLQLLRQAQETTAHLDLIDCSAGMVRLADRRIQNLRVPSGTVRSRVEDVQIAPLSGPYDLVVSHFFLDCFSTVELNHLVPRIAAAMESDALWLISEFAVPAGGLWKQLGNILIRLMYLFFRLTTGLKQTALPDYEAALAAGGLRLTKNESALRGLVVAQLWSKPPPK